MGRTTKHRRNNALANDSSQPIRHNPYDYNWKCIIISVVAIGVLAAIAPSFLMAILQALGDNNLTKKNLNTAERPSADAQNPCSLTQRSAFFSATH